MRYCPYCSAAVSENATTCHACKKSLNLDALREIYMPGGESSTVNKAAARRLWLKENARYFWPVVGLLIGIVAGGLFMFFAQRAALASQEEKLNAHITALQDSLQQQKEKAAATSGDLASTLENKEKIITALGEQRENLARIIAFTRRLANNTQIVPSDQEAQYFRNNVRYLIRQYEQQDEVLRETGAEPPRYNLQSIPQLLE